MAINRIYVDQQVDNALITLVTRTGIKPNLLCRIGFCLSLTLEGAPDPQLFAGHNAREFNLPTLVGPYRELFFALLRERLVKDELDLVEDFEPQFKAHLSRGAIQLSARVHRLEDVSRLVGESQDKFNAA